MMSLSLPWLYSSFLTSFGILNDGCHIQKYLDILLARYALIHVDGEVSG
jgi:hypothetical protein